MSGGFLLPEKYILFEKFKNLFSLWKSQEEKQIDFVFSLWKCLGEKKRFFSSCENHKKKNVVVGLDIL